MKQKLNLILFIFFLIKLSGIPLFGQTWINNGPYGGFIISITIDPADTNNIYAGTYGAGMFKSANGGSNWNAMNDGIPIRADSSIGSPTEPSWWFGDYFPITTLKIAPDNHLHLYAGMLGAGIAQSLDGGNSWVTTNTGLPDSSIIRVLWIHPRDPAFLLCGTDYPSGGLYRSVNGGHNWTLINNLPNGATYHVTTIANDPVDSEIIYTGLSSAGEPGFAWGLLRSSNRGVDWEVISQDYSFYDIEIDPANTQYLWSVVYTGFLEWMLFSSADGGSTWNPYPDLPNAWKDVWAIYADSDWNLYVISNEENSYKDDTPVFRKSTDRGQTWFSLPLQLPSVPKPLLPGAGPNIAANPLNTQTIYFGTEAAVYRSNDGGETATTKESNMINTYINDVVINPQNPEIIYAGGSRGFWKSSDGGDRWLRLSTSTINSIAIDPQHPDTLYRGGDDLMRSFDGGYTWENIKGVIPGIITDITVRNDSSQIVYTSSKYFIPALLFQSKDFGTTWVQIFSSSPAGFTIESITLDNIQPQIMYFGATNNFFNHGLYKSLNSGQSWIKISDPGQVISIAQQPGSSDTLFVATTDKLHISFNGGSVFEEIGQTIPSTNMSKIVVEPLHPSTAFAGTRDKGIFYSRNFGKSWHQLTGEYETRITGIAPVSPGQIFLATHGAGIWRGDNILVNINSRNNNPPLKGEIQLLPPYPNPFNSQTIISFYLPQPAIVEIFIFNIQGQLVKKLVNNRFTGGRHQLHWNGTDTQNRIVASGIYFIRLRSSGKTLIRKLFWLK